MEGDLINLPLDGKGTDIAGKTETQILGGEPDLISRTIDVGGRPMGICIGLVSPHYLLELELELDMSGVPNSRARNQWSTAGTLEGSSSQGNRGDR